MKKNGLHSNQINQPLWLLAELTYRCPLQCPYCSNPLDYAKWSNELTTQEWISIMQQAREMGVAQLGFSGGEPLVRQDLNELVVEAKRLGFYSNLITSGVGMDEVRVKQLKESGLDHIQISFQASSEEINNMLAGSNKAFAKKIEMAKAVKDNGYPMVLNFVIHRYNVGDVDKMLELAERLGADYVELANAQYYGWALENRDQLLPSREQIIAAEKMTNNFRENSDMEIYFVVPDYFESRPKPCMGGWGAIFLAIAPDGTALPCHSARMLPIEFPNAKDVPLKEIWNESDGFNMYRGDDWMKSPCRSCPEKSKDYGGCRCQAYLLTGDASAADPVCDKSEFHYKIQESVDLASEDNKSRFEKPLLFRNKTNSEKFS